jgi:hypothetical protein
MSYFDMNGKQYKLELGINEFIELEEIFGDLSRVDLENIKGIKTIRAFLWACLLRNHAMSMLDVGNIIEQYLRDGNKAETITEAIKVEIKKFGIIIKPKYENVENNENDKKK